MPISRPPLVPGTGACSPHSTIGENPTTKSTDKVADNRYFLERHSDWIDSPNNPFEYFFPINIMFALQQKLVGPAASLATRSFRSNAACLSQATPMVAAQAPARNYDSLVQPSTFSLSAFGLTSNWLVSGLGNLWEESIWSISTLKRRRKMMNKHKLRKRRKKNRMKNKK